MNKNLNAIFTACKNGSAMYMNSFLNCEPDEIISYIVNSNIKTKYERAGIVSILKSGNKDFKKIDKTTTISDFYLLWKIFIDGVEEKDNDFTKAENIVSEVYTTSSEPEEFIEYPKKEWNSVCGGIFKSDLVVIGGDTGKGKSQKLHEIAYNACKQDKKVAYFDFENDKGDFVRREVATQLSKREDRFISVNEFRQRSLESFPNYVADIFAEIDENIRGKMLVFTGENIPTIEKFINMISFLTDNFKADLIVIDHLHYFSMHESKESGAIQIATIMRELRKITKENKIPVVIGSHLKQRQGNKKPTNFDLFGSSNIAKEATQVILLSGDENQSIEAITKTRSGGRPKTFNGVFNPITREVEYQKGFNSTQEKVF